MGIISYEYSVIGFIEFDGTLEECAARQDAFIKEMRAKYDTPHSVLVAIRTGLHNMEGSEFVKKTLEFAIEHIKKVPSKDVITTYNKDER